MKLIALYVLYFLILAAAFAVGNQWRTGDADVWGAISYAVIFVVVINFYTSTNSRLDAVEREARRLKAENEYLAGDIHVLRRQIADIDMRSWNG